MYTKKTNYKQLCFQFLLLVALLSPFTVLTFSKSNSPVNSNLGLHSILGEGALETDSGVNLEDLNIL